MRSSNPALAQNTFSSFGRVIDISDTMTISGTVTKTAILLLCVLFSAGWTWSLFAKSGGNPAVVTPWMIGGAIGGFIAALATIFKKEWAPVTAPIYALFEGLFIGGISSVLEAQFSGIVIQAASLTFGTLAMMLFLYQTGLVRATEKFKLGVFAATGAVALIYLATLIMSFFGFNPSFIYGNGIAGIAFSLIVVGIAALNFIIDFDFIENGARYSIPKYMEWYGGFALMVTLIWLYIEFLRLLSKARSR
jgi:uncharacterized YccA/Bax inhibitor family protein